MHVVSPALEAGMGCSFREAVYASSCNAVGDSSGRVVTLMIVRNGTSQVWTELSYSTAVILQYRVSPASEARILSEIFT